MNSTQTELEHQLATVLEMECDSVLRKIRSEGTSQFLQAGIPHQKQEGWRTFNISHLQESLKIYGEQGRTSEKDSTWADAIGQAFTINLVNGYYFENSKYSMEIPPGLEIQTKFNTSKMGGAKVQPGELADIKDNPFTALNTALFQDGLRIVIKNDYAGMPIHIAHHVSGNGDAFHVQPRILIESQPQTSVKLIETFSGVENSSYFTNRVMEMFMDENSVLDYVCIQNNGQQASHIGNVYVQQEKNSRFNFFGLHNGGELAREDIKINLCGPEAVCNINGLSLGTGKQQHYYHTFISHIAPKCASAQLFKSVLDGESRGIFNGRIKVLSGAIESGAEQLSKALLLSPEAITNSEPQLEIYENELTCSHGASVGRLDDDQLFYLTSRGLEPEDAKRMLISAFAGEVFEGLHMNDLRNLINNIVINN